MIVTSIVPVDKRKSKVFVDEGFAFVLYRGEINRLHLKEGEELPLETYERIERELLDPRARARCVDLLKLSDKTEGEIRSRLSRDGYPLAVIDRAVEVLYKHRYLDDASYATRYVENVSMRKSPRQIAWELRKKGVDSELAAQAIKEAAVPQEEAICALVKKKTGTKTQLDRKEREKLFAFLGRKGYSYEAIRRVLGEFDDFWDEQS